MMWNKRRLGTTTEKTTNQKPQEPTLEERISQMTSEYESARSQLFQYYMDAIIEGDIDTQADLQIELVGLKESYEADVTSVINNEEV